MLFSEGISGSEELVPQLRFASALVGPIDSKLVIQGSSPQTAQSILRPRSLTVRYEFVRMFPMNIFSLKTSATHIFSYDHNKHARIGKKISR